MSIALISLGLFLLFAMAFNGGVGNTLVNYSFFLSASSMIIAGALVFTKAKQKYFRIFCISASFVSPHCFVTFQ
jgi:hypothetical protein